MQSIEKVPRLSTEEINGAIAQYDGIVKKLIVNKAVLGLILQRTVRELAELTTDEILECIVGEPEVAQTPVMPSNLDTLNTESSIPGEGMITYDVRLRIKIPSENELTQIIINIEAQKDPYPGYHLGTRAVFYCSRLISAQKTVDFSGSNYDDIKKVYSIWLCMNAPKTYCHSMTSYRINKEDMIGNTPDRPSTYDKMEIVMIYLNDDVADDNFIETMGVLLSKNLTRDEKIKRLKAVNFPLEEVRREEDNMCNLGMGIFEDGIEQGIKQGMEQGRLDMVLEMIRDGLISKAIGAAKLNISEHEIEKLLLTTN
ncbi:MAG: hypothetical protein KBS83_01225 [Lachnospiraceae bacterium]|nr:hypothetical protein [Candidatus Equihabitans merdae]